MKTQIKANVEVISCIAQKDWVNDVLEAGADAIYCGLQNTSWHNKKIEFSWKDLIDLSQVIHEKGKKLYLAINRNLSQDNIEEILEYMPLFEDKSFNAIIVSDWGLIKAIREKSSEVSIHLSANTACVNTWDFELAKELDVNRVIFSSTLNLNWIKYIVDRYEFEWEAISYGSNCINEVKHCLCYLKKQNEKKEFFCSKQYRLFNEEVLEPMQQNDYLRLGKGTFTGEIARKYFELGIYNWKIEGRAKSISHIIHGTKVLKSIANELCLNNEKDYYKSYSSNYSV